MSNQTHPSSFFIKTFLWIAFFIYSSLANSYKVLPYDSTAYTKCRDYPEPPLYNGGIFNQSSTKIEAGFGDLPLKANSLAYRLDNLEQDTKYSFSCWIKIIGGSSGLVQARLWTNTSFFCVGSVMANSNCWSFLKGGFELKGGIQHHPSEFAVLLLNLKVQSSGGNLGGLRVASSSVQPFTNQQWTTHQEYRIRTKRKRAAIVHVVDSEGQQVEGASITVKQVSKDFPFGSAIASTIIGNAPYQKWFTKRFNAAVFENELKWYATESVQGELNYTLADQLLSFTRANKITVRGHNIFWDDPRYTPGWVLNLTTAELHKAVESRIQSLVNRYKGEFIHWDVNNEMLHYHFFEEKLGPNTTLNFFKMVHKEDPRTTLVINDYNITESCDDFDAPVDAFISKIKELKRGGAVMEGIGLEGHFYKPNIPLMRATLDKLQTLGLPIWFTEIDISNTFDQHTQAVYLEEVLREGFSHPSVKGMLLWSALHPNGCYQMCLTDNNFRNLPAGDVVDKLLREWETGAVRGKTDERGSYSFDGFLGEYQVLVKHGNKSAKATLFLHQSEETGHFYIHL